VDLRSASSTFSHLVRYRSAWQALATHLRGAA